MSRNKKIIISVTGIIIVVLALLGLTYAYFVTQIQGNESDKSIEVSTANLRLTYADGNGIIIADNIMPGTTTEAKTFTVKNSGNQTVGNYKVYLESVINTFTNTDDVVINMTCSSDVTNKTCTGLENFTFPTTNDLLVSNSIDIGETQTYSLTVTYKETGVDQSVDMGKTFSGKIQIYDARNVVDISGVVPNATDGDYVELHSDPKVSQINNNKEYKITGVSAGEHTFYIKDSKGNIKGSKTIIINRANFISHDAEEINITNTVSNISIDVTTIDSNLGITINNIMDNPYNDNSNTLAYNLLNNAQLNKNRTTYEPTPITVPGKDINAVYSYEPNYYESELATAPYGITVLQQEYYWTYADSFNFDKSTGKFNLVNPKTCKYSECYASLVGKYVVSYDSGVNSSSSNVLKTTTNSNYVYKVNAAPTPDVTKTIYITYKGVYNIPDSAERTISKTEDDYGDSYYFRGDIKDNYVNFNGMCWRIMRIEGDGSVKLILEDKDTTCNSGTYTGNYQYTIAAFGYTRDTMENGSYVYKNNFLNYEGGLYDKLKDFQTNKMSGVLDKLKNDEWCYDDRTYSDSAASTPIADLTSYYQNKKQFYYAGWKRLYIDKTPSLKCNGTKLTKYRDGITKMYVGTMTADELNFSGAKCGTLNYNHYLMNKWNINRQYTWTLTPMYFYVPADATAASYVNSFGLYTIGALNSGRVGDGSAVRASVSLLSGTEITSGDGTQMNPYEIK